MPSSALADRASARHSSKLAAHEQRAGAVRDRLRELAGRRPCPWGRRRAPADSARAAYAASDADVLPVDAHATRASRAALGLRHRDRHAAILERSCRIVSLVLDEQIFRTTPAPPTARPRGCRAAACFPRDASRSRSRAPTEARALDSARRRMRRGRASPCVDRRTAPAVGSPLSRGAWRSSRSPPHDGHADAELSSSISVPQISQT